MPTLSTAHLSEFADCQFFHNVESQTRENGIPAKVTKENLKNVKLFPDCCCFPSLLLVYSNHKEKEKEIKKMTTFCWIMFVAVGVAAFACVVAYEMLKPISDSYKKMVEKN